MNKPKPATGTVTEHGDRKQFGKGPSVSNTPLKKSGTNPEAPLLREKAPHGAKSPVERPNQPLGTNRHVAVDEAHPAGRDSTSSTFRAPRGGESHNPVDCGYTKPGKM